MFAITLVGSDAQAIARDLDLGEPVPLDDQAFDLFAVGDIAALRDKVAAAIGERPIDFAVQPAENRRKRLLIADMDSTIIGVECLDELADFAGVKDKVSEITERAMRGELAFEGALRERVGMLTGLSVDALQQCYDQRVRLNPGAEILVRTMARHGARCALVSGGFTFFTTRVAEAAGFHLNRANTLIERDGALTGQVGDPILGKEAKLAALDEETSALGLTPADALAVGDGANDLAMIEAAGLGVAYRAKPIVAAQAHAKVDHTDLTTLLYFQGYKVSEFAQLGDQAVSFPRRVEGVVFDMDGLLLDTEIVYRAAMIEAASVFDVTFTVETYAAMVGKSTPESRAMMLEIYGEDFPVQAYFERVWADVEDLLEAETKLKAGVVEILDYLDDIGMPRGIATSNSQQAVERYLGRFDLLDRFNAVVAHADVQRHKPHPDPYLEAARRIGVDPTRCLALEDSHPGVRAAHAAGMMTVMVPDILDPNEEMHDKCVHIAESLHVVLDLLKASV